MTAATRKTLGIGFVVALAGAILHSGKAIFTKLTYAVEPIDAETVLTLRMLFSLPFYVVSFFVFNRHITLGSIKKAGVIKQSIWIGLLFYISAILDFEGLKLVTASIERLILFIYPSLVLLFLTWFFKKKIKRYQYLALLLTYTGILVAFIHEAALVQFSSSFLLGSFYILLCSAVYAWYIIRNSHLINKIGVEKATSITMTFCALAAVFHFIMIHPIATLFVYQPQVYVYCIAMALVSTVLPTYMIAYGIKKIGSGDAAIVNSAGPVSTIIQAHLVLGEHISIYHFIGTALVIAGIAMIGRQK